MLSHEDNQLMTRVEGDAPMGRLLRRHFWVPALRVARLEPDGPPQRVRLFGLDFVAFRATDGQLGFFDERCPHRGVSLALARNEDNALRCIFHGWKFDVSGRVVETPTHPVRPEAFAASLRVNHYPVREEAGVAWVYLGDLPHPPEFPRFEFMGLPAAHFNVRLQVVPFNWVQGIEATLDSSHVGILHANWVRRVGELGLMADHAAPTYEVQAMPYGLKAAAFRTLDDGRCYVRVTQLAFPWTAFIPPSTMHSGDRLTILSVPVDDLHTLQLYYRYNVRRPISHDDWNALADPDNFAPLAGGADQRWGQDRAAMKAGNFSGFNDLALEDFVVQASMGALADRSREQLALGDQVIVRARRLLLKAVADFQAGAVPDLAAGAAGDQRHVRAASDVLAQASLWQDPAAYTAEG